MVSSKSADEILIAVVGVTGTGKSTFIRRVTGNEQIVVGHDLNSMTSTISSYQLSTQVNGETKRFTLVDTPGFDDGERTDDDVFHDLAKINANREKGSDVRSLKVFKRLCGEANFSKIILGITWWNQVDGETALARERILCQEPTFWGDMIAKGAKVRRIESDKVRAIELLHEFVGNEPAPLQIQLEMAGGKLPGQTSAATELEEYKAIRAIKLQEELDMKAQKKAHELNRQELKRYLEERLEEQRLRNFEIKRIYLEQTASLATLHKRLDELNSSRTTLLPEQRQARVEQLSRDLKAARQGLQPPTYSIYDNAERLRINRRTRLNNDMLQNELKRATDWMATKSYESKQQPTELSDPTTTREEIFARLKMPVPEEDGLDNDLPLCYSFCDRCMKQASIRGYWGCYECKFSFEEDQFLGFLLCNQCKVRGLGCFDSNHSMVYQAPRHDFNKAYESIIEHCPPTLHTSTGIRCNHCGRAPGPLFMHCCECDDHGFDMCIDCFMKNKTCKKRKEHTLFVHSWCSISRFQQLDHAVAESGQLSGSRGNHIPTLSNLAINRHAKKPAPRLYPGT